MLSIPLILTGTAFASLPLSTSEWLPLLQTDGPMADDLEPTASLGHVDIVGDGSHPSGEWSMDASTVYVRMRLSSSPADLSPIPFDCGFLQCQWGVLIDTDDDLSNFERALVLTDGAASIQLRTDTVGIGPLAETEAVLFDETDPMGSAMVRASEAWSSSTGATHAFLEFAVPRVWLNLSTATATVRVTLATGFGIPGDGFSVDLSSSDSLESLEGAWSIPIGLDGDGDELMLSEELELGSDPQDADTDDDGLDDREERDLGTSPILSDTDADELSDWDEVETYGTNPVMADTDGDGITDGDEVILFGTDPLDSLDPDPSLDADCDGISDEIDSVIDGETDADGDGLSNEAEWECASDPCVANSDIDDDGISNVDELLYGTNPCDGEDPDPDIDDDCDGIPDYADTSIEFANNDVDSDGILNEDEASCGTDPCTAEEDHDADGISTQDEIDRYGTDPCDIGDPDASIDEDCDGIPDYADELVNFDPLADNDGDHIPNGHELDVCQSDPCTPNPDRDRDGVSNEIEATCGTDPCSPDSDADGLWDGVELTDEECTDSDNDGTIDALDPNAPVSPDPTRPEAGNFGLSGGSFTGGGCSNAPHSPVPWLAGFAALLLLGRRTESATVLLMAGALHSTHARAQSIDADRFRPASTNSAFAGLMDVTDSATEWTGSAWFHYANSPLMYRYTDPESNPIYLVRSLWTMTPQIEYRHVDWLASASMPVHVLAASDDEGQWFEAGDTRISVGHVFADRNRRPIGMALTSTLTLPTGNQGAWLGRSSTRAGTMGHFTVGRNALLAAAIGFEAGSKEDLPGITIGSDLLWNVGASLPIATQHRVSTEIDSTHGLNSLFTTGSSPIEASAHWHWALAPNWVASVGGATALTQGIGAPKYRVVAGIRRTPLPAIAPPKSLDPAPTKVNKAPVEMSPAPAIDRVVHIAVTNATGQPLVARIHSTEPSSDDLGATNPDGLATLSLSMDASAIRIHAADHAPTIHEFGTNAPATVQLAVQLAPARVHIGASQLRIDDKIFFESGAALIEPESHSLLNEIALVLLDNPTLAHVQIHGHTDSRGSDADNRELSMQRATAVMDFLIRVGINPDRLSAHGFGESKPIDPSPTPQAHATNRRVEFHITDAP